jgi:hypothetical protein
MQDSGASGRVKVLGHFSKLPAEPAPVKGFSLYTIYRMPPRQFLCHRLGRILRMAAAFLVVLNKVWALLNSSRWSFPKEAVNLCLRKWYG